jgi:hypothetical protein
MSVTQNLASAMNPTGSPQPDEGFNGPQGNTFASGIARLAAPQVPMRPAGQTDDAGAPPDIGVGANSLPGGANSAPGSFSQRFAAALNAPSNGKPLSFAAAAVKAATHAMSGAPSVLDAALTGVGDAAGAGSNLSPGQGWAAGVSKTLANADQRQKQEAQQKFENSQKSAEQQRADMEAQARTAHLNLETQVQQRVLHNLDQADIDKAIDAGKVELETLTTGYQGNPGARILAQDIHSDEINSQLAKNNLNSALHHAIPTGKDADGRTLYTIVGDLPEVKVGQEFATRYNKVFPNAPISPDQVLPGIAFRQMGQMLANTETAAAAAKHDAQVRDDQETADRIHVESAQFASDGTWLQALAKTGNKFDAIRAIENNPDLVKKYPNLQKDVLNLYGYKSQADWDRDEHQYRVDVEKQRHDRAEEQRQSLQNSGDPADAQALGQMLVEGTMDPSQLSKRAKNYNGAVISANNYSMTKYGKPFDIAQAQTDYKYANQKSTKDTLNMINGMTEKGGAIDIASQAAAKLPRFDSQLTNKIFNATETQFGSDEATNFHTAMLGLADEYSKVMGGGVSSDAGRQQALDILKNSYSAGQLQGAINIMRQDIAARKRAIVGGNRYLQSEYGEKPSQQTQTQPAPQTHVFDSKAWAAANPGKDVNSAIAAAKQQGYEVR